MSIWNLPLCVDMPEVRTPTPAPLASLGLARAGRSLRYGLTVLDAARSAVDDLAGCEEVRRCAACGCDSTVSISGAAGWHVLRRCQSKSVAFCPECYRDFEPVRMTVAGRYAEACENYRAAKSHAGAHPRCLDARTALAIARMVLGLERREWLDGEQEGGSRKAS